MPESIVVIGCGPAGMFFCHAMETMRREMLERGESIDNLPSVTVFERDASPGGVWRSERNQDQQRNENQSIAEEKKIADIVEPIHNTQMVRIARSIQVQIQVQIQVLQVHDYIIC
jgi:protoporphyrinogen oxidase